MQNLECYDILTKMQECQRRCGVCELNCEECEFFVSKSDERQALEFAKVAVQEREVRANAV